MDLFFIPNFLIRELDGSILTDGGENRGRMHKRSRPYQEGRLVILLKVQQSVAVLERTFYVLASAFWLERDFKYS